jgi:hypothetical protein
VRRLLAAVGGLALVLGVLFLGDAASYADASDSPSASPSATDTGSPSASPTDDPLPAGGGLGPTADAATSSLDDLTVSDTVVSLSEEDRAILLFGFGTLCVCATAALVSGWGRGS